jgi:ABC-type Fe3+-hydroxamate transport system substrate-binding protein
MKEFRDQIGQVLALREVPARIVSLVPSQSEFLWDLGLKPVGITRFCIHPVEMFKNTVRVGGTKDLDLEKIRLLRPDLLIGNKEENDPEQIRLLGEEFNVWISDINTFDDAYNMMLQLSEILGLASRGQELANKIRQSLLLAKGFFAGHRTAYFIWRKPYMLAAKNTFIDHMLEYSGFKNAVAEKERYPVFSEQELRELNPEYCFLSSEPYPFKEKHIHELREILPASRIVLVDGEMFSWYGSRLLKFAGYLPELKRSLEDSAGAGSFKL